MVVSLIKCSVCYRKNAVNFKELSCPRLVRAGGAGPDGRLSVVMDEIVTFKWSVHHFVLYQELK